MDKMSSTRRETSTKVKLSKGKISKPTKIDGTSLKHMTQKKRKVFKPILTNPYTRRNQWPILEPQIAENVMTLLNQVLSETGKYNRLSKEERKKLVVDESKFINFGFNSTMELLEEQIKKIRQGKFDSEDPESVAYVFVCKLDLTSSLLYMHFPIMSRLAKVKLVQLPKGSNEKLKGYLGVGQSVEILTLKTGIVNQYPVFRQLVESKVEDVEIPFLDNDNLGMDVKFELIN